MSKQTQKPKTDFAGSASGNARASYAGRASVYGSADNCYAACSGALGSSSALQIEFAGRIESHRTIGPKYA